MNQGEDSQPAFLLDRDGVMIRNLPRYVRTWDDVEILPGTLEAFQRLARSDYKIVIVTNQSGIGRGLIDPSTAEDINRRLIEMLTEHGGRVDGVYMCPHSPAVGCDCRKPSPGLIHQAAEELNLDLAKSILIGDALSDIHAGAAAGVGSLILVLTGRGRSQSQQMEGSEHLTFTTHPDLLHAVSHFLDR